MSADEMRWFALAAGAVIIALAVASDYAVNKWRLVGAGAMLSGAASLAQFAINGPGPDLTQRFGAGAVLGIRLLSGAFSLWVMYLAIDQFRIWWRRGDNADD